MREPIRGRGLDSRGVVKWGSAESPRTPVDCPSRPLIQPPASESDHQARLAHHIGQQKFGLEEQAIEVRSCQRKKGGKRQDDSVTCHRDTRLRSASHRLRNIHDTRARALKIKIKYTVPRSIVDYFPTPSRCTPARRLRAQRWCLRDAGLDIGRAVFGEHVAVIAADLVFPVPPEERCLIMRIGVPDSAMGQHAILDRVSGRQ